MSGHTCPDCHQYFPSSSMAYGGSVGHDCRGPRPSRDDDGHPHGYWPHWERATGGDGLAWYPIPDHRARAVLQQFGGSPQEAPQCDILAVMDAADTSAGIRRVKLAETAAAIQHFVAAPPAALNAADMAQQIMAHLVPASGFDPDYEPPEPEPTTGEPTVIHPVRGLMVEAAARALFDYDESTNGTGDRGWDAMPEDIRANYRTDMSVVVDAILAALAELRPAGQS